MTSVNWKAGAQTPSGSFRHYLAYWLWQGATKCVLGVIYLAVISEGLRLVIPPLAQKLHKLPALAVLREYEATYQLDLASFFSVFLLFAVWVLWDRVLRLWLGVDAFCHSTWQEDRYRLFIKTMGTIVLLTDAALFYAAMTQMGWRSPGFSVGALLATTAYLTVLIFASFVSISLHERAHNRQES